MESVSDFTKYKYEYNKAVYKTILAKYREATTKLQKKSLKDYLYSDPYLSEDQKDEIWSKIIQLEYLKK